MQKKRGNKTQRKQKPKMQDKHQIAAFTIGRHEDRSREDQSTCIIKAEMQEKNTDR